MKIIFTIILFVMAMPVWAQQIDQLGVKKGIKVTGGVGLSNNFYLADGISNRVTPYSYVFSGNVNFNLYGISIPFSFAFSNQNFSYRQPFNIVGASPSYKKWTAHVGYRNLSFSPYTLNGHNFLGGGLEYQGELFNVMVMSGRFLKAVAYDTNNRNALPSYQRMGGGIKVNYKKLGDEIFVSGFYAKDLVGSIAIIPKYIGLNPQENQVWSIGGKKSLFKNMTLSAEGARSAWTSDMTTEGSTSNGDVLDGLYFIPRKQSTVFYDALKAGVDYAFKAFNVGVGYERVEPEFRTLGAYYFNNDLENITVNFSAALLKNKINLSGNGGFQRDDLKKVKASSMNRKVGSLNVGFTPNARLNMNFSYSNFYSFLNIKPVDERYLQNSPFNRIDTLNFTQLSQSTNASLNYKLLESDAASRSIGFSGSFMEASNKQGAQLNGNSMANGGINFTQAWKKSGLNFGVNVNGNQTAFDQGNSVYVGGSVNSSMPVLQKKMRVSMNVNFNQNYERNTLVARLYSVTNAYSLRFLKKHSANASLRYSGRAKVGEARLSRFNATFNEFFGSLGYAYSF